MLRIALSAFSLRGQVTASPSLSLFPSFPNKLLYHVKKKMLRISDHLIFSPNWNLYTIPIRLREHLGTVHGKIVRAG